MQDPSQTVGLENVPLASWQTLSRSADYGITGKCHGIDVNFPAFDNWLYNRISLKYLGIEA